jgi:hypothetical protein
MKQNLRIDIAHLSHSSTSSRFDFGFFAEFILPMYATSTKSVVSRRIGCVEVGRFGSWIPRFNGPLTE